MNKQSYKKILGLHNFHKYILPLNRFTTVIFTNLQKKRGM